MKTNYVLTSSQNSWLNVLFDFIEKFQCRIGNPEGHNIIMTDLVENANIQSLIDRYFEPEYLTDGESV